MVLIRVFSLFLYSIWFHQSYYNWKFNHFSDHFNDISYAKIVSVLFVTMLSTSSQTVTTNAPTESNLDVFGALVYYLHKGDSCNVSWKVKELRVLQFQYFWSCSSDGLRCPIVRRRCLVCRYCRASLGINIICALRLWMLLVIGIKYKILKVFLLQVDFSRQRYFLYGQNQCKTICRFH